MPNLQPFLHYLTERQQIFHKRFEMDSQEYYGLVNVPPLTKDKFLERFSYCNVYRELDRTTLFGLNHIFRYPYKATNRDPRDVVFSTILFRFFNRPLTYAMLSKKLGDVKPVMTDGWYEDLPPISARSFNGDIAKEFLDDLLESDPKFSIISHAYTISSHKKGIPTHHDIIDNLLSKIADDVRNQDDSGKYKIRPNYGWLLDRIAASDGDLMHKFYLLRELPYCGPFMAYEILCDLNYSDLWNFSENDFVNLGPGAIRGLKRLHLSPQVASIKWLQQAVNEILTARYTDHFDTKGYFPFFHGRKLSLRSIEHSLCEFDKYQRVKQASRGTGPNAKLRSFKNNDPIVYRDALDFPSGLNALYDKWYNQFPEEFVHKP